MKKSILLLIAISSFYINANIDFTVDNQTDFELMTIDLEAQSAILPSGPIGGCSQVLNFQYYKDKLFLFLNEYIGNEWQNVKVKAHTKRKISVPEYRGQSNGKVYICTRFKVPDQLIRFQARRFKGSSRELSRSYTTQPIYFQPDKTYVITATNAVDGDGYIVPSEFKASIK